MSLVTQEYSINQLKKMNSTSIWKYHIILPTHYSDMQTFKIYATGKADLDGRYYVAIRSNRFITNELKRIYNIF